MTQDHGVNISCIIPRNDQWNQKVREVNDCLICICENESISLIYHSISIDPRNNLNNSKLHLNFWGAEKLRYNFIQYLKGFSSWEINTKSCSKRRHGIYNNGVTPSVVRDGNPRFSSLSNNVWFGQHFSNLRKINLNRFLLAHIIINSVGNRFVQLVSGMKNKYWCSQNT